MFRVTCDQDSVYVGATSAEEAVMKAGEKMKINDTDQVIIDQSELSIITQCGVLTNESLLLTLSGDSGAGD